MKYNLGSLIGKGSDGEVYDLKDNKRIIKFIQPTEYGVENYIEFYILLNLKHPNLISAHTVEIEDNGLIKIVQDKANCDLGQLLYVKKNKINHNLRLKYIKELVSGIAFLHSYNIVHGDIKPANLLIYQKKLLINDFSLSRLVEGKTNRKLYTYIYRPPECNLNKFSLKSDIYSLGCTIYEIYYNQPYYSISGDNRLYHIHASSYYENNNNAINKLIKNMVCENVSERINIDTVCNFFNLPIPEKKYLIISLSSIKESKVFNNKIDHMFGKIKMNNEEKKYERFFFQNGFKIFDIKN